MWHDECSSWSIQTGRFLGSPTICARDCSSSRVSSRLAQFLHSQGPVAVALSPQLLKSGTSAGANYEEADDGSSPSDTLAKRKIVLRELKETNFRLRVLRAVRILTAPMIRSFRRALS